MQSIDVHQFSCWRIQGCSAPPSLHLADLRWHRVSGEAQEREKQCAINRGRVEPAASGDFPRGLYDGHKPNLHRLPVPRSEEIQTSLLKSKAWPLLFSLYFTYDLFPESFKRASYARADGDPAVGGIILATGGQGLPMCAVPGMNWEHWEALAALATVRTQHSCRTAMGSLLGEDCHLAYKSKAGPQAGHVAPLGVAWDRAQVCQLAFNGKKVPSALLLQCLCWGQAVPCTVFIFHRETGRLAPKWINPECSTCQSVRVLYGREPTRFPQVWKLEAERSCAVRHQGICTGQRAETNSHYFCCLYSPVYKQYFFLL